MTETKVISKKKTSNNGRLCATCKHWTPPFKADANLLGECDKLYVETQKCMTYKAGRFVCPNWTFKVENPQS